MEVRYTRPAIVESMPDEKITKEEVEQALRKAELRTRISEDKFKCRYKDVEVVCLKLPAYWLVITCYRFKE